MTVHHRRQDPLPDGWWVFNVTLEPVSEPGLEEHFVADGPDIGVVIRYHNGWRVKTYNEEEREPSETWEYRAYPSWAHYEKAVIQDKAQQQGVDREVERRTNLSSMARAIEDLL